MRSRLIAAWVRPCSKRSSESVSAYETRPTPTKANWRNGLGERPWTEHHPGYGGDDHFNLVTGFRLEKQRDDPGLELDAERWFFHHPMERAARG